jgi:hypothetical protein
MSEASNCQGKRSFLEISCARNDNQDESQSLKGGIINKEKFLTVRWNNQHTLALGLPALIYFIWAFSRGAWSTKGVLIWLVVIGVLYRPIIKGQTSMRFAWLKDNSTSSESVNQAFMHPLAIIRKIYNAVFIIFLLPFIFTSVDYSMGFIVFTVVIAIRLVLNLYTNNALKLTPEQYDSYPFRIP